MLHNLVLSFCAELLLLRDTEKRQTAWHYRDIALAKYFSTVCPVRGF